MLCFLGHVFSLKKLFQDNGKFEGNVGLFIYYFLNFSINRFTLEPRVIRALA